MPVIYENLYLKFKRLVKTRVGSLFVHSRLQLMSVIRKQLHYDVRITWLAPVLSERWQVHGFHELYWQDWTMLIEIDFEMSLAKIVS